MSKIEIHNIQELIEQKYPVEIIEKFLNDILILGIQVSFVQQAAKWTLILGKMPEKEM